MLTDALSRTVMFGYDVADRVTTQTLPNMQEIGFAYDASSNVTALTPPGRPAHTFSFTAVNLISAYTPPTISVTGPTGYLFNVDRQPTAIQRPDGLMTTPRRPSHARKQPPGLAWLPYSALVGRQTVGAVAIADVAAYIDTFYNPTRRHSYLAGVSSDPFEAAHRRKRVQ